MGGPSLMDFCGCTHKNRETNKTSITGWRKSWGQVGSKTRADWPRFRVLAAEGQLNHEVYGAGDGNRTHVRAVYACSMPKLHAMQTETVKAGFPEMFDFPGFRCLDLYGVDAWIALITQKRNTKSGARRRKGPVTADVPSSWDRFPASFGDTCVS